MLWWQFIAMTGSTCDLFPVSSTYLVTLMVQVVSVAEAVSGWRQQRDRDLGCGQEILHVLGQMVDIPHDCFMTMAISPHILQSSMSIRVCHQDMI